MHDDLMPPQITEREETVSAAKGKPAYGSAKLSKAELRACRERFRVANAYHEKVFLPWHEECLKLWKGEHYKDTTPDDHRVVVNVYPHVIETQVYSVAFHMGEIILKPQDPLGWENHDTAQRATHYAYREACALREARRAFKDAKMFNFGVVMTGWEFETDDLCLIDGRQPVEGEEPEPEAVLKAVEEGRDLPPPVPKARVRKDQFYVKRVDPRSFRISPESSWVIEDAPYCGYVECREVSEVKADPRYKNTRQLKGSTEHLKGYWKAEENQGDVEMPSDLKRVQLWHYYEKKRRLHLVFCDEHQEPLLVEKWHWEHDRYPFRLVFSEPGEDQFYQKPPMLQIKHMQQEINHFHTQLAIHIRRFVRRYVARKGAFDQKAQKQARSGIDGTIIETTEQDPSRALVPVQDAQLSPDVYNSERAVMQYLTMLSALDQYEMSRAPTKRMTQSEVAAVQQAGGARQQAARAAFETLCAEIAEDCLSWLQQNAIHTRQLPIYQDNQIVEWRDWSAEEIKGKFSFEVYVGSTEVKNKQGQIEEIGFLLQALTPFFGPGPDGMPMANPKPLLRQLLALIPEIRDVSAIVGEEQPQLPTEAFLPDGGDPLAELAAQGAGPLPEEMEFPPFPLPDGLE